MRTRLYDRRIAASQARIVKFLPLHLNCSFPKTETSWKFCLSKTEANLDAGFRKIMARKKNAGLSSNGDALWMTALSGTSTLSKKRSASVGSTARPKKRDSERRSVLHHVAKKKRMVRTEQRALPQNGKTRQDDRRGQSRSFRYV